MFEFTGHYARDIGVATITRFCGKNHPSELTVSDIETVVEYVRRQYPKPPLRSYLTIAFTTNGWFIQNAYNPDNKPHLSAEEREELLQTRNMWGDRHLVQWTAESEQHPLETDIMTGTPAVSVVLSGKLEPGRAGRAQLPLTAGDDAINFYPNGNPGLPVSGETLLAMQVFPLGCIKISGGLLAVHSDNEELILDFAGDFLNQNRRYVQLAQDTGEGEISSPHYALRTLLIDMLLKADRLQREAIEDAELFSMTAYHLNNGKNPYLEIYHLPMQVVGFLRDMHLQVHRHKWNAIVQRAWEVAPTMKGGKQKAGDFKPKRNWLYEDIFTLPGNAYAFLRTYFLRTALRHARQRLGDPSVDYSMKDETELISWDITARFLKGIMNMEKERIDAIRTMGDRLADYVVSQNDRYLFANFRTQNYHTFRTTLLRASRQEVSRGNPPLLTFDPYVEVFEVAEDYPSSSWRLARDLLLIRMTERLYELGWLKLNTDSIPEVTDDPETV
jgi:CRISPR-associated protein Cst1